MCSPKRILNGKACNSRYEGTNSPQYCSGKSRKSHHYFLQRNQILCLFTALDSIIVLSFDFALRSARKLKIWPSLLVVLFLDGVLKSSSMLFKACYSPYLTE